MRRFACAGGRFARGESPGGILGFLTSAQF